MLQKARSLPRITLQRFVHTRHCNVEGESGYVAKKSWNKALSLKWGLS